MRPVLSQVLSAVPGIAHGFGTRSESFPQALALSWDALKPQWKQVHGTSVAQIERAGQVCGEVDALWSRTVGQPTAIITADCVPVLLARQDGGAVAAVHAGWRGTQARILRALWVELLEAGEKPGDWVAAIGPSIGPCCYEVSETLAAQFETQFAEAGSLVAVPRFRHLDLPAVNAFELRTIGLKRVDLIRACTRCSLDGVDPAFHSYRREGGGTRQFSVIVRSA